MLVTFYKNFSKRKNSTKRPSGGESLNCMFKQNTSYENPTFMIHSPNFDYNYAKWGDHYYFINDIVIGKNDIYEVSCTQDVLATFKNDIADYEAIIERSSNISFKNSLIYDSEVMVDYEPSYRLREVVPTATPSYDFIDPTGKGCYMIKTTSKEDSRTDTGVTVYMCTPEALKKILNFMFRDYDDPLDPITDYLVKTFFNPFQYVQSIQWVPHTFDAAQEIYKDESGVPLYYNTQHVYYGWWSSDTITEGLAVFKADASFKNIELDIAIPDYTVFVPSVDRIGPDDWRWYDSRCVKWYMNIPGNGLICLDSTKMRIPVDELRTAKIKLRYRIDIISGYATVEVVNPYMSDLIIYQSNIQLFIPVQISQVNSAGGGTLLSGAAKVIGGIASENPSMIASGAASIGSGTVAMTSAPTSSTGSFGHRASISSYNGDISLYMLISKTSVSKNGVLGYPVEARMKISDFNAGDYIKCRYASVDAPTLGNDKDEINAYLNDGFYYE